MAGWTVEGNLGDRMWSHTSYATWKTGPPLEAGFELLPTPGAPYYDVVLSAATAEAASTL